MWGVGVWVCIRPFDFLEEVLISIFKKKKKNVCVWGGVWGCVGVGVCVCFVLFFVFLFLFLLFLFLGFFLPLLKRCYKLK